MSGSVNRWALMVSDYANRGMSIPKIADRYGITRSKARYHIKKAGKLRTRAEGVRLAAKNGDLGSGFRGKKRVFTDAHKKAMSDARQKWSDKNAVGVSYKTDGYVEYTRGPNKGRSVHVVEMEKRLGRSLLPDECVHHIDGNKQNNNDNNLALVTRSGHMRLHRYEDNLSEGNQHGR